MQLTRREVLLTGAVLLAGAISPYEADAPEFQDPKLIKCDLHCHISTGTPLEDLIKVLSKGVVVLASRVDHPDVIDYNWLSKVNHPSIDEVEKGLMFRITHGGNVGYAVKGQEIVSDFHILSIGLYGVVNFDDSRKVIQHIQKKGALAGLNHPFLGGGLMKLYIPVNMDLNDLRIHELYGMVDIFEKFNSSALLWMKRSNEMAAKLQMYMEQRGLAKPATAVSDSHLILDQVYRSHILIPRIDFSYETFVHHLKSGDFTRVERYSQVPRAAIGFLLDRSNKFSSDTARYLRSFL